MTSQAMSRKEYLILSKFYGASFALKLDSTLAVLLAVVVRFTDYSAARDLLFGPPCARGDWRWAKWPEPRKRRLIMMPQACFVSLKLK